MSKKNKYLMLGALLLAVAIPLTTWLAENSQENRSKATSEMEENTPVIIREIEAVCGEVNGTNVEAMPDVQVACASGAVNWMDSEADDGSYDWNCIGTSADIMVSCSANKK